MRALIKSEGRWITAAAALSLAVLLLGVVGLGRNPALVLRLMVSRVLLSPYGLGQTLYKTTTLIFTGLACALAFRCGLFNIGAEGQVYAGGFLMTAVGLALPGLPAVLLIPLLLVVSALGGGLWALLPGYLKAKRGAHEVITTMMMNFIALALTNYLVMARVHVPETIHTQELPAAASLPLAGAFARTFQGSAVNASLLVALALAAAVWYFLWRTPLGFELRAVGANPEAARSSGVPVESRLFLILVASGALAGLAGVNFILGYKHYFEQGFAAEEGFLGIAVALVAKNHPVGVVFAALLFALLSQAGLALNTVIPRELFEILQSAVIFIVVICQNRLGEKA
ncbi:MAG: ABC transporter permease [Elusimicrobia bacterium]|nr:ABC transporter permease [Elusimicrobiota bacterium]